MKDSNLGCSVTRHLAASLAAGLVAIALVGLGACGQSNSPSWDNGASSGSGTGPGGGGSSGNGGGPGNATPGGGDGGGGGVFCTTCTTDAGSDSGAAIDAGGPSMTLQPAIGMQTAADCMGCTFPPATAMPCPSSAPSINIVYPNDTVLLPPNMNVISVQWTPYGAPYTKFSVDFSSGNTPSTDWHIITACSNQTIDAQSGMPSGGCEVTVDPVSWSKLVGANRGQGPVTVTVRGTTDGMCATASQPITINFAEEDLLGTYYYWQSLVSPNGTGGQIWKKTFGDIVNPEVDVTSAAIPNATCNGCHSLSRDGTRMVVYSDDDDSDDEYSDVAGSYLDMTTMPNATVYPGGVTGVRQGGQPAGFSTIDPTVTSATSATASGYYITSNGYPCNGTGGCGTSNGYPAAVPTNGFSVWNGTNGAFINGVTVGGANTRPTMPDWSPDGKVVIYVQPAGEFTSWRQDDAHIYGGSLYTVPYTGMGTFGTATALLTSSGENNYYPSYSPDVPMTWIIFNRVAAQGQNANCSGGFCPDDSFSNPSARLFLLPAPGGSMAPMSGAGTPIDLEKANASPATAPVPLSNSYPRWAPFVQKYRGNKILWFTFSSTRDYGVRVVNQNNSKNAPALQKAGMYQCYPADSAENPGTAHHSTFAAQCQEPQLWMAPLFFSEAQQGNKDPSGVAFWIPYQSITTHNHTAQWTWIPNPPPPPNMPPPPTTCMCQSMVYGNCGPANGGCGCCSGTGLACNGSNQCFQPPN